MASSFTSVENLTQISEMMSGCAEHSWNFTTWLLLLLFSHPVIFDSL